MGLFSAIGSIIGGSSQKKAAKKAADAQVQVAETNNALARDIYGKNEGYLSPYAGQGLQAGNAIMELLGFSPQQPQATPQPQQNALLSAEPDYQSLGGYGNFGGFGGFNFPGTFQVPGATPGINPNAPSPATPAKTAFDRYRDSTGYQFRMDEGMNALASDFRGRGISQSGAAQKSLLKYGQDYGSNEFGRYLGYLSGQQGVGLSGASALAGVGQNFVNNVSGNNQSAADARSNAALLRGNATAGTLGTLGSELGDVFKTSFGGGIF